MQIDSEASDRSKAALPTVLAVDDDPFNLDVLSKHLKRAGFRMIVARDGESALEKARYGRPDLILLDLLMPAMDGFETCHRLKSDEALRDIPIIFMTALTDIEAKVKGFQAGGVDYITKPFQFEEVLHRIKTHLSLHRMQKQLEAQKAQLQQEVVERRSVEESLKASEEKYRTLVEHSTDAILMLNPERKIISFNQAFLTLFGFERNEIEGKSARIIHPSDESFKTFGDVAYPIIKRIGFFRTEWNFIRRDGKSVPVETVTSAIKSPEGAPTGFVAVIRDITERRRVEEELRRHREHLEELVAERTAELTQANNQLQKEIADRLLMEEALQRSAEKIKLFAYSVSHDLKSPAIGIFGLTKLLSRQYRAILDERGQRCCDQILKTAEQITLLVEKINLYMSTKHAPLKVEKVNPKEIFQTVKEEFSNRLKNFQIRWLEPDLVPEISADPSGILRILRNLVDNALKYGGDQLSEIRIGYQASERFHILSVTNDGICIRRESSERIFDPFQRDETTADVEGTGLGLAIVKELADHHGGRVWVESGAGKGTTFYVSISKNLKN